MAQARRHAGTCTISHAATAILQDQITFTDYDQY